MHPSLSVHPGAWLKTEIVEPAGVEINDIADNFGVIRQAIGSVLNAHALSAPMAVRFERAFGVSAATLLRMQARYDLARAYEFVDDEPIRAYS